jgi:hypothetical protein
MSTAWMLKVILTGWIMLASTTAWAQVVRPAFRIETDLYFEDAKQPTKQNLTLFYEGVFYDFARDMQDSITVIDPNGKRIILLDRKRNVQARIAMDEILAMENEAQKQLVDSELSTLIPKPELTKFDPASATLTIASPTLEYQAKCERPNNPDIAIQYAAFADWSSRLNAFYSDRPIPPFARLVLNREVANRGLIPGEIRRISSSRGKKNVVTSKLLSNWTISKDDEMRITKVGAMLVDFKIVDISTFLTQPSPQAAQKKAAAMSR